MENPGSARKKWTIGLMAGVIAAVLLGMMSVLAGIMGIDYLVDIWWFDALGYGFYYWQRMLYRYAVFLAVMLAFFLIFFLNFWIAARFLKKGPVQENALDQTRRRKLFKKFQTGSIWFYGPLSAALSIPIALPLFRQWERFLFFIFGRQMGTADPFLGKDVAFYLFSFPIYSLVQRRLMLDLQMQIYAKYHQEDTQVFYQQEKTCGPLPKLSEKTTRRCCGPITSP
jgi:hypothetical protein